MEHRLVTKGFTRKRPPGPGEDPSWWICEHTGEGQTTCSCGLDTGIVPRAEAVRVAQQHREKCIASTP